MSLRRVAAVVIGWMAIFFPEMVVTRRETLGFYSSRAPEATLEQLLIALFVGLVLIFSTLAYLFYVFKRKVDRA